MKIYTKGGDQGETGLYGGSRVPKDHLRIQCYGTLDEVNAAIGLLTSDSELSVEVREKLTRIQSELFQLGSELATPADKKLPVTLIEDSHIAALENEIDEMEKTLPPLKSFILPGGSRVGAQTHLARTIVRRAERELVGLNREDPVRPQAMKYVNRLSDYLFVTARYVNHLQNIPDVPWIPAR